MENTSILDKIINSQKAEEIAKLNVVEIVRNLFNELSERERDILTRRFGLHGKGYETLENVGQAHGLTRERIRQIESASIKKLLKLEKLQSYIETLKNVINQLLEEHGGIMEKDYLLMLLIFFSTESEGGKGDKESQEIHKNHLDFLISRLLDNEFEEVINSDKFKRAFKLKYQDLMHLEEVLDETVAKIKEEKKLLRTNEVIDIISELDSYAKHKEKFDKQYSLDISRIFNSNFYHENTEIINNNKVLYSLLRLARDLEQNKFGHWGLNEWKEINPKTINDKIFLVLKDRSKPMHFVEIAERINEIVFDGKKANPATVHNELILDDKYVLIGRGIYGLKDWGYNKGTVAEVINEIMSAAGQPLTRQEIIDKVLAKRIVKETTIILALMNRSEEHRVGKECRSRWSPYH
jgi:hypothetical protein